MQISKHVLQYTIYFSKNKNTVLLSCHSFENVIHYIPVTSNGLTYDAKIWRYAVRSKRKLTRYNVFEEF